MLRAETEIKNLKGLTSGMDTKVDQLIIEVAKAKITSIVLDLASPVLVGLIVYLVTKGAH
jgi:hypothetical protein